MVKSSILSKAAVHSVLHGHIRTSRCRDVLTCCHMCDSPGPGAADEGHKRQGDDAVSAQGSGEDWVSQMSQIDIWSQATKAEDGQRS